MNYRNLSIDELHELLVNKKVTPLELAKEAIRLAKNDTNNAFEFINEEKALEFAKSLTIPEEDNPLWGIPYVAKDNFSTKDIPTTASSNILNGYVPLFDASVIEKLTAKKAVLIGKTTLDELAMGGTGTTGHLGITYNPHDRSHTHLVGGSSCGSAAAIADGIVPFALGSDTGDSTRKPASFAGLVGLKPTWSRISRYGLFPFAQSLDTVGIFTRNVKDCAYILNVLAGRDDRDSTSSNVEVDDYTLDINKPITGLTIGVIEEIVSTLKDQKAIDAFNKTLEGYKQKGAIIKYVHISNSILASLLPTYFVISCAEATSNNANLDGIKFGPYSDGSTYEEVVTKARTKGFSELIKRRFVIGSYALMSENQNELFIRAQKNRRRIVESINKCLSEVDVIYTPAAPSVAPKFSDKSDRLSDEYLIADNHLVLGNFAGLPSITVPIAMIDGLPYGANLMTKAFSEKELFRFASALEEISRLKNLVAKEGK